MKTNIWLVAGIAGMLLSTPFADARAKVTVNVGIGVGQNRGHHHHLRYVHRRAPRRIVIRTRHHEIRHHHHNTRTRVDIRL